MGGGVRLIYRYDITLPKCVCLAALVAMAVCSRCKPTCDVSTVTFRRHWFNCRCRPIIVPAYGLTTPNASPTEGGGGVRLIYRYDITLPKCVCLAALVAMAVCSRCKPTCDVSTVTFRRHWFNCRCRPIIVPAYGLTTPNASPIETHVNFLNSAGRFHHF